MTFLGLCSYSHTNGIWLLQDCDWLPITCVVSYIMASNMGLTTLPYIFISEFYSPQVRLIRDDSRKKTCRFKDTVPNRGGRGPAKP